MKTPSGKAAITRVCLELSVKGGIGEVGKDMVINGVPRAEISNWFMHPRSSSEGTVATRDHTF